MSKIFSRKRLLKCLSLGISAVMMFSVTFGGTVAFAEENDVDLDDSILTAADDINPEDMIVADSIVVNTNSFSINPFALKSFTIVTFEIYEMLFQTVNGVGTQMIPVLADATRGGNNPDGIMGFDHEEGSCEYTIYIYDNIYDSAGHHITASDVVFSFEQTLAYGETSGWGAIVGWEAVDDTTVVMTTERDLSLKGELENIFLRCFIVSEEAYNESPSGFVTDACGTGPYVLTDLEPNAHAVVEARDDYWQTDWNLRARCSWANVQSIKMTYITESSQVVTSLESGDLNFGTSVSADLLTPFFDGGDYSDHYNVYTNLGNGLYYLEPNCSEDSPLSDINLRLAIFYCIDNDNVVLGAGANSYSKATAFGPNRYDDYNEEWDSWENYVTVCDLDLAKEYLEASDYNGESLRLLYSNGSTGIPEIIQAMCQQIGITIELVPYDQSTATTIVSDPTEWDLYFNVTNGDWLCNIWSHVMNADSFTHGYTEGFVDDQYYQDLLQECLKVTGTPEEYNEFWQYTLDNAYILPLCTAYQNTVYENNVVSVWMGDRIGILPGAMVFSSATAD